MLAYSFFENDARMMQYAIALTERGDQAFVQRNQQCRQEEPGPFFIHLKSGHKYLIQKLKYLRGPRQKKNA